MNNRVTLLFPILFIAITSSIILSNPAAFAKSGGGGLKQIPSETTDYPDNNPNAIEVKTFKASKDIINFYHVKGEVKNIGSDTLDFIHITAHLFDSNNQPIGTTDGYTDPDSLDPGHSGTFDALIDAKELSGKPTSYRLSFDWQGGSSNGDDNADSSSSNSSSSNDQPPSNKPQAELSKTLQIPKSPSSSTIPSQNTTTASPPIANAYNNGPILSGLSNQSNLQQPPRSNVINSYNNADNSSDNLLTYRSPEFGFSIQYPASWKIIEHATSKQIVSFHLPKNEVELSVSIDVSPSFRDTTLAKYVGEQLTLLMHNRKGFDISESKAITIAGKNQAQEVVYTFTKKAGNNKGDQYKTDKLWMLKDDKVFTVAYFAAANKYSIYFPIAQQMIESFKITR